MSSTSDSAQRFSIFVPSPKARINMGKGDPDAPFGYTGLSLQSDVHLFIDANKHTLFQTGQNYNGQVGGWWGQWANSNMFMSCTANLNMSADAKITIAAGAGQGQITALDHGTTPRLVGYNSLKLHYKVDAIQCGLFEFFEGRRERKPETILGMFPKDVFLSEDAATQVEDVADLKGGFYKIAEASLRDLFPGEPVMMALPGARPVRDGHPIGLLDELAKEVLGSASPANLTYGYSKYFSRFDPYAKKKPPGLIASIHNGVMAMKRYADVALKYGSLVTDNFIIARALKLADAVQQCSNVTNSVLWNIDVWSAKNPNADTSAMPGFAPFQDEFASGMKARVPSNTSKAKVSGGEGPFALSHGDVMTVLAPDRGTTTSTTAISALAATVTGTAVTHPVQPTPTKDNPDPTPIDGWGNVGSPKLYVTCDKGGTKVVSFTGASTRTAETLRAAIQAALGGIGTAELSGEALILKSATQGYSSRIQIAADSAATLANLGLPPVTEVGSGNVADASAVTADELIALISGGLSGKVTLSGAPLTLTSTKEGVGSYVKVTQSGTSGMATAVGLKDKEDEVKDLLSQKPADVAKTLISANHEMQKWPEDVRNMTRPLTNSLNDVVAAAAAVENIVNDFADIPHMPGGKEVLGVFAQDGISLGTKDRIVAAGGKGIVLIADGGGGEEDHSKFVFTEAGVKRMLDFNPWPGADPPTPAQVNDGRALATPSLGFRVISDSVAEVTGTTSAQLLALGRAKLGAAENGKTEVGIGVARVAGSRAAEVCGFRKVVISARDKGAAGDADGVTGGRVELVGQTIAVGGVNWADNADIQAFKAAGGFGVEAPALANQAFGGDSKVVPTLEAHAWPQDLRENHANTARVTVHASKETVICVGPYMVQVSADDGIRVGLRQPNADAAVNAIDDDKPSLRILDGATPTLAIHANKDTRSYFDADGIGMFHKNGAGGASFYLADGEARMMGGDQDSIELKVGETTLTSAKISLLGKSAVNIRANGTIKLG